MAIKKSGDDSSKLDKRSLRDDRVEQRRNYTEAAQSRGADGEGIRRGTNRVYNETFGGKPSGSRDDWTERQQKEITVSENFAANKVRGLSTPDEGSSQSDANDRVVNASGEGAKSAREYIDDQAENGNFWTRLFG